MDEYLWADLQLQVIWAPHPPEEWILLSVNDRFKRSALEGSWGEKEKGKEASRFKQADKCWRPQRM